MAGRTKWSVLRDALKQRIVENTVSTVLSELEQEAKSRKTLVFAFGRFNPPTRGHEALISGLMKKAVVVKGDLVLFVSSSTDAARNPLTFDEKVRIIKKTFPKLTIGPASVRNPFEVLSWAQKQGYGAATMMIGEDDDEGKQYQQYKSMIETWQRSNDPNEEMTLGVETIPRRGSMDPKKISGSRARDLARRGDYSALRGVMMSGVTDKMLHDLVAVIQQRMGALTEDQMSDEQYDHLVMETIDALFEEEDDAASDMTPDVDDMDVDGSPDTADDMPTIDDTDPYDKDASSIVFHPKSYLKFRLATRAAERRAAAADAPTYKGTARIPTDHEE